MSNDPTRLMDVKFAPHASTTDYTSTPSTGLSTIMPRSPMTSLLPRQRTPAEQENVTVDGRRIPYTRGAQDLKNIVCQLDFKGINANSGAAVSDWEAKQTEIGYMLSCLFGADATATVGDKPTTDGGTTPALDIDANTGSIDDLDIIAFPTATGLKARQVTANGGTGTVTLDRAYGGAVVAGDVIRMARWTWSPATNALIHGYFRGETRSQRRDYFGCQPLDFELVIPDAGKVEFNSNWKPSSWADVAEANPSFVEPTTGAIIASNGACLYIGSSDKRVKSLRFMASNGMTDQPTTCAAEGVLGGVPVNRTNVMMEFEIYVGDSASDGELVDGSGTPSLTTLLGSAASIGASAETYDLGLQIGNAVGAIAYIRIPEATIRGEVVDSNGLLVYKGTAYATGETAFYLGLG